MTSSVFSQMARTLTHTGEPRDFIITWKEYQQWEKVYIFDALAGRRLGESFCEYFGIGNAIPLYYFNDNKFSERWIKDQYLV
jgi:hypothetical protein